MDTKRFDAFSKALALPARRRSVVAGSGGALLGLLGVGAARAQDNDLSDPEETDSETGSPSGEETGLGEDGLCRLRFEATARIGSGIDEDDPPIIVGLIAFEIGDEGVINTGRCQFERQDGEVFPVTGQATGRSFLLRIDLGGDFLTAIGTGEERVRGCAGRFAGFTAGPRDGDLGNWTAFAEES